MCARCSARSAPPGGRLFSSIARCSRANRSTLAGFEVSRTWTMAGRAPSSLSAWSPAKEKRPPIRKKITATLAGRDAVHRHVTHGRRLDRRQCEVRRKDEGASTGQQEAISGLDPMWHGFAFDRDPASAPHDRVCSGRTPPSWPVPSEKTTRFLGKRPLPRPERSWAVRPLQRLGPSGFVPRGGSPKRSFALGV